MFESIAAAREHLRQALLLALQVHEPNWKEGHLHWMPRPATFGSHKGVIELQLVSSTCEAERQVFDEGVTKTRQTFRDNVDVSARLGAARNADNAGKLLSALRRQDFLDALAPMVRLRLPSRMVNAQELHDGRSEETWTFEIAVRYVVEYPTATETKNTIDKVTVEITATPEFEDVPLEIEAP